MNTLAGSQRILSSPGEAEGVRALPANRIARSLKLVDKVADTLRMSAIITVTDAAGRVLCRRPATDAEILNALAAAETAELESAAAMQRIAQERAHCPPFEAAA